MAASDAIAPPPAPPAALPAVTSGPTAVEAVEATPSKKRPPPAAPALLFNFSDALDAET